MATNVNVDKVFRVNNSLCHFSRNGAYLAIAFQANLLIKDAKTFDTCRSFVFMDMIQVSLLLIEKMIGLNLASFLMLFIYVLIY